MERPEATPPRAGPPDRVAALLAGYRPRPGVADEAVAPDGSVRPAWRPLLRHLAGFDAATLATKFARGNQYLHDAGVFYRLYGAEGPAERDWPLSHIPVIVHETEWRGIAEGLEQRAELLERVVADLYGEGRLVAEGHLPAALVAGNPEWLRPLVGVTPRSGHFLHFLAFEIGRNPDGSWFVLSDRTQAPSGAGFALETRVATSRVFSTFYPTANVHRLASFFRAFRDALNGLQNGNGGRVGILTPGPANDSYFEHTYIARYLGFMLLEGEDIVVQDGHAMVRTVAGLKPISVLWRRMDARFADPLELDPGSHIGTPGMAAAARAGALTLVNALGSGVLEARAMLAFLPRLSETLLGEPLRLPNIATWWCGQPAERAYVATHADRMTIGPALQPGLPFDRDMGLATAGVLARLEDEGAGLVAQEAVSVSTTPTHVGGVLRPAPLVLRAFAARTPKGWVVMPGGYARIGRDRDATALALQRGGSVADVWIVSDGPVAAETMLAKPERFRRSEISVLPSRAADNLFWLGRYVERFETLVRLMRAWHLRLAETGSAEAPLVVALGAYLARFGAPPDEDWTAPLAARLGAAQSCAAKVRDRFSVDGWIALAELAEALRRLAATPPSGDEAARALGALLRQVAAFSGLVQDNMYRFTGWRFLRLGRALERAEAMAAMLATFADPAAPEGALDLAVELGDSLMTHRRRYSVSTARETVIDLLALDGRNPRSVLAQVFEARRQVKLLPGQDAVAPMPPLARRLLEIETALSVRAPEELTTEALTGLGTELREIAQLVEAAFFT